MLSNKVLYNVGNVYNKIKKIMLAKLKYLYALPFVALMIWVLTLCAADLLVYQASKHENKWYLAGKVEDKASWDSAHSSLKTAMILDPYNPDHPEMMGRLYVWRYSIDNAPVTSITEADTIYNEGIEYLRLSVYKRPTSLQIHSIKKDLEEALEDIKPKKL